MAVVALLALIPVAYFLVFARREPLPVAPPAAAPVAPKPMQLHLDQVAGKVEVRRGGTWRTASPGEELKPSDAVRTEEGAYAVLIGGEAYEVRMEPGTEVAI